MRAVYKTRETGEVSSRKNETQHRSPSTGLVNYEKTFRQLLQPRAFGILYKVQDHFVQPERTVPWPAPEKVPPRPRKDITLTQVRSEERRERGAGWLLSEIVLRLVLD